MSKYIELGKAVEAVNGAWKFEVESPDNYRDIAVETLKLLPSVEVVRCRECRYREKEQPGMIYCPNTVGGWVDEDWFCAGGEKE